MGTVAEVVGAWDMGRLEGPEVLRRGTLFQYDLERQRQQAHKNERRATGGMLPSSYRYLLL